MEPQLRYCTSADGTRIAHFTYGEPRGVPLVFVSGWGFSQEGLWGFPRNRAYLDELGKGRWLVGYDRRGIGASQREFDNLSDDTEVSDLAAVVDHLGLDPFDLIGWLPPSVTIAYPARYRDRVRRLVVWNPVAVAGERRIRNSEIAEAIRADWSLARRGIASLAYPADAELQRWWSNMMRDGMAPDAAVRLLEFEATADVTELLPKVVAPTLLLFFAEQRTVPSSASRQVAALIPNARFVSVDSDFYTDERTRLVGTIHRFLDEGREEPSGVTHSVPVERSSGMTAILFADIVDSTGLTERLGDDAFRDKARDLDAALRTVIREQAGTAIEGKLLGDGVLAVFTSARQAIEAALRCGRAGDEGGLPLHLGIHAGDVIREDNNVYGGAVNIASRISALSAPGEVLVSETVRSLARTSAGVRFEDRGEQTLKGIDDPLGVWAVVSEQH